ncbi:MAG: HD domain-containing protein [Bacteroidales bacterium]|nr:HD domain-containing protein [Bacteroidales bacterium]
MIDFEGAKSYIIARLREELNPDLKYHSLNHTIDVYNAATNIAKMEGVKDKDLGLLQMAALYHDSGLLYKYKGHEEISSLIVQDILPKFGYSKNDISSISSMILATCIPQHPHTLLEKIICDADLDYMGRDDFFMNAMRLKHEWMDYGIITNLKQWYSIQVEFLQNHKYFTNSAIKLRQEKKMLHLLEIKELFAK